MHIRFFSVAAFVLSVVSLPAFGDDLFTLTTGSTTASFTLPASPVPSGTGAACDTFDTSVFCVGNVPVTVNGVTSNDVINFYDASQSGGLSLYTTGASAYTFDQIGAQLYTGTLASPTFTLGSYELTNSFAPGSVYTTNTNLSITAITPEPSSFFLLGSGVLGVAGIVRRRLI